MAETKLTSQQPLRFTFVPTGVSYSGNDGTDGASGIGTLLFDEGKKVIKVRGIEYGYDASSSAADSAKLAAALDALVKAGLATEDNGVYTAVQLTNAELDVDPATNKTIKNLVSDIKDLIDSVDAKITGASGINAKISTIEANITGVSGAAATAQSSADAAMTAVQAAQTTADGKVATDTADETLIYATGSTAISLTPTTKLTNAVTSAESAIQSVTLVGATAGTNIFTQDGNALTGSIDGAKIKVGTNPVAGASSTHANKTVAQAIDDLEATINTLQGGTGSESLSSIIEKINEIKQELQAEGETGTELSATLLDTLRLLKIRTSGSEYVGWDSTGSGTTGAPIALQTSLNNLASAISANSTADQAYAATSAAAAQSNAEGYADTKDGALKDELLGTTGTTGADTIRAARQEAANALAAAQAAASSHNTVAGVSGASAGTTNYVMVDSATAGSGTGAHTEYTVKSTAALDTALNDLASGISANATAIAANTTAINNTISWNVVS